MVKKNNNLLKIKSSWFSEILKPVISGLISNAVLIFVYGILLNISLWSLMDYSFSIVRCIGLGILGFFVLVELPESFRKIYIKQ
jgi:hypothetical protein